MPEQLKKEAGVSQPAGSEGPKKSAPKKSLFRGKGGTKKKTEESGKKAASTSAKRQTSKSRTKKAAETALPETAKKTTRKTGEGSPRRPFQDQAAGHPPGRLGRDWQELDRI